MLHPSDPDDTLVVGRGLAGAAIVAALSDRGIAPRTWLGSSGAGTSSSVPCALVHPFPGRSFTAVPHLFDAWSEACALFDGLGEAAKVHAAPLRRMIGDHRTDERLVRSFAAARGGWPEALRGHLEERDGARAIAYGPVRGVHMPGVVAALHARVRSRGGPEPVEARVVRLDPDPRGWVVWSDDGRRWQSRDVVVAAGPGTAALLRSLGIDPPLEHHEGVLVFGASAPLPAFVVQRGHVCSTTATLAWGSSYRRLDGPSHLPSHREQLTAIETRLRLHCPALPGVDEGERWSGVRVVHGRTRAPWVETLRPGLHVFGAFGSKGGLWVPWWAARLADRWSAGRLGRR